MKILLLVLILFIASKNAAQNTIPESNEPAWSASLSFYHDFFVKGYVQVREFQYTGDKLSFSNDFGMNQLNSASGMVRHTFKNQSAICASYQYYFFSGSMVLDRDIWFNGTHVDGTKGISINETHLSKIEATFEKPFHLFPNLQTTFIAGLLYHRLIFRMTGTVLPDTYRNELHENFMSQSLPYPQIGFRLKRNVSLKSSLSLQATGTYIPIFESFFYEGGDMHLHYYAARVNLAYNYSSKHIFLSPAMQYSTLKTYQYSAEDTNDFFITAAGIVLTAGYKF